MISDQAIVNLAEQDTIKSGKSWRLSAESYGHDVRAMIAWGLDPHVIRLQAWCAFRMARRAIGERKETR